MVKLHIMSDLHREVSGIDIPSNDADVIILAGDIDVKTRGIEWAKTLGKPVIYVYGNHEFYREQVQSIKQKSKDEAQDSNVYILDDEDLILEINGEKIRFLGGTLWTDFCLFGTSQSVFVEMDVQAGMNDYKLIKYGPTYRKLRPIDTKAMHIKTLDFLKAKLQEPFDGKTVVITHHAPSILSVAPQYKTDSLTPGYASSLEYLMDGTIVLWIHGHVHHRNDYEIGGTRVISNPRGYQTEGYNEETGFDPNLVVEV